MDSNAENPISLKKIVEELALPNRPYDRNIDRHVRQPAQIILNDTKSKQYFSRAASISEAARSLRLALNDQENHLVSIRPSERSRVWYDADAVESTEHQPEIVAEVLFLLDLLSQWADRVSSSALPIASLDQVLPLARRRDQNRLEKIGLLRRDAENLVNTFVPRWSRRDRLARQMFATAANPPNETDSVGASTMKLSAISEAEAPAKFPASPSPDLDVISPHLRQLQGCTGRAAEISTPPLRISDLLVEIAEKFCKGRNTTMPKVTEHVLGTLDRQVEEGTIAFPFKGMEKGGYLFTEKGQHKILDSKKIEGRLRKNPKLVELIKTGKNF